MINIDNEYYIKANDNCFTLEKKGTIQEEKSKNYGKETFVIQGHYTSIENTLKGYMKIKTRKFVASEDENTLTELLKEIEKQNNFIIDIVKEV